MKCRPRNKKLCKITSRSCKFCELSSRTRCVSRNGNSCIDINSCSVKINLVSTNNADTNTSGSQEFQTIEVVVPAGRGVEYKFAMQQYAKMTYEWLTDGEALYFDLHGEPEGDTTGYFESYTIAASNEMKGSFTAPFAGSHGWYWKNETDNPIAVQLLVKGQYEIIGLKQ